MTTIIETNNLTKIYGKQKAVDNVNIKINQGDIYGLIGRNGAGKTTLMKMICGLTHPTSGTYTIYGINSKNNEEAPKRVSSLIEDTGIYPNLNALDHIILKSKFLGINDKKYGEEILQMVGLKNTNKKKVKDFSLGMKARLGLGLSLVGNPDIIILDEPINGLDPQGIVEVRNIIEKLNRERKITFLISSHILDELAKISTNFAIINEGELIANFTRKELENENKDRLELITNDPKLTAVTLEKIGIFEYKIVDEKMFYIYLGTEYIKTIINELKKNNLDIEYFNVHESSLEDYYLKLLEDK